MEDLKQDKKGQMMELGDLFKVFMIVIIGAVFVVAIVQENSIQTDTVGFTNVSTTMKAKGYIHNFTNYQAVSNMVAWNYTNRSGVSASNVIDPVLIPTTNYTTYNYILVGDNLAGQINVTHNHFANAAYGWNLTYTAEPLGYNTSSGARTMANLIDLFAVLILVTGAVWGVRRWWTNR